jgi:hypothetical protein
MASQLSGVQSVLDGLLIDRTRRIILRRWKCALTLSMELVIERSGHARCIYGEEIDLAELGQLTIRRGSHVERDARGRRLCDLSSVTGPLL